MDQLQGPQSGASGRSTSRSVSNGGAGAITGVQADASAPNPGSNNVTTRTVTSIGGTATNRPAATSNQSLVQVTAQPLAGDVSAATAGRPNTAALAAGLPTDALALVILGGGRPTLALPGTYTATGSISMTLDPDQLAHGSGELELGLIDSQSSGKGFDSFRFLLTRTGTAAPLIDRTFVDLADAQAYFNDQVIDLGRLGADTQTLNFAFELTSNINGPASDAFNVQFLVADVGVVPEPSAWVVVLAGAGLLRVIHPRRTRTAQPK